MQSKGGEEQAHPCGAARATTLAAPLPTVSLRHAVLPTARRMGPATTTISTH